MDEGLRARGLRGLVVAVVTGLVAFGLAGGGPFGGAGAAESPPAPEFLNADANTSAP
jgi:hypothetical protein